MAKLDCHFFPNMPAAWICDSCHTQYGEKCIPAGHSHHWGKVSPNCIRCNSDLRYLGTATGAKPFWQKLPHFFAYPLHVNSLVVIALVSFGALLLGPNLLSIGLLLLGMAVVFKYGFAIIEQRGAGNTTPPEVWAVLSGDEHHLFLKFIAVMILVGAIVGAAAQFGEIVALAVGVFMTLAMPACIMILAVEKSVFRAVNPLVQLTLMLAVGWPYLLLWLCAQIISAGPFYVMQGLVYVLPQALLIPVTAVLTVYFTFVFYTMLGYALFEYQHELGFAAFNEDEEDDELDQKAFDKAKALGEMTVLIRDGKYQDAREVLRKALDLVPDDVELHQQYHKLLMLLDDDRALANHGEYFLGLLNRNKQLGSGTSVLLDVQGRLPGYQLEDTALALQLAEILRMQGQHKAVLRLFHNRHKAKPNDPLLPAAYLHVAQVFFEYLNDEAKALAIINFVLKKFPNCREREQFLQLQQVINQPIAAQGG
jgi:tetratricopeptide (TPR) repeat protein